MKGGGWRFIVLDSAHTFDHRSAPPRVSVVLVNWNRREDILDNVAALRRQHYRDFEIIVVDNGSTDGSVERLRLEPDIRLVEMGENRGPSAARNVGVERAKGEYTFFLDSDAVLSRRGLTRLVHLMDRETDIGLAGCRVLNYFTREIDQWIYSQPYASHARKRFETYSFSAAGAIVRTKLFREVGGFWEQLFIYNEEVELSIKIHQAGYRVIYCPQVTVFHRVAPEGRTASGKYFYYQCRNWIWIFYRHYPLWWRWRKVLQYCGVYLVKGLANRALGHVLRGIAAGLSSREILADYPRKLDAAQVLALERLNRRRHIRMGR